MRPLLKNLPIILAIILVSCSSTSDTIIPPNPEQTNQANFEVLKKYYCTHTLTWPSSLDELRTWADAQQLSHQLNAYVDGQLSSPRRVLLTVSYVSDSGPTTVTFIAPPACDEAPPDPEYVSMVGGGITFTIPPGFKPLNAVQMTERWGSGPYPDVAWGETLRDLLVSVRFGEADASAEHLGDFKAPLEAAYAQSVRGITWKVRKFGVINSTPWIRLAYESDSSKGRLYNTSLTTTFQGKLFTISFASPVSSEVEMIKMSKELLKGITIAVP